MSAKNNEFTGAVKTADGVTFNGVVFEQIIDKCEGCGRVRQFDGGNYCSSYPMPQAKWSLGICNFSTHARVSQAASAKVNPLKASKRAAKGKK